MSAHLDHLDQVALNLRAGDYASPTSLSPTDAIYVHLAANVTPPGHTIASALDAIGANTVMELVLRHRRSGGPLAAVEPVWSESNPMTKTMTNTPFGYCIQLLSFHGPTRDSHLVLFSRHAENPLHPIKEHRGPAVDCERLAKEWLADLREVPAHA